MIRYILPEVAQGARSALRNYFEFLLSKSIRSDIPYIPQKSYKKEKPKIIPYEVIEEYLQAPFPLNSADRDLPMISLLANTGLKAAEFLEVEVDQVDLCSSSLVNVGNKPRTIKILSAKTIDLLRKYLEYRGQINGLNTKTLFFNYRDKHQLSRVGLDNILKKWAKYHRMPFNVSAEIFRFSYRVHLKESGYSTKYIMDTLGIEHSKNAEIYH